MNVWKPIALISSTGFALLAGVHLAAASAAAPATPLPAPAGICQDQVNMAAALTSLKAAKASLDKAEHNKGGWRAAAITATNTAIAETERGCAFAK